MVPGGVEALCLKQEPRLAKQSKPKQIESAQSMRVQCWLNPLPQWVRRGATLHGDVSLHSGKPGSEERLIRQGCKMAAHPGPRAGQPWQHPGDEILWPGLSAPPQALRHGAQRWASADFRPGSLRPLLMLAKPFRGLRVSVPGTFPLGGPEDEAQDAGFHPGAPEPELAGEASPQPSELLAPSGCGTLEEGSAHPRSWRGLVRAHELVHAGEASLDPLGPCPRRLATGWAGGQRPG
ncbi:hypothetical protein NDU88_008773 [Pleurodeles waltl]|uniref:Uncharacterized protein n=1 Tax=Pleurodeles waltl TaxID=8319 RepID=A0AAV7PTW1_PLEWA|nr:hypothetical protein NDU88_008773 [Pleurodeles waltl]